MPHSGSLFWSKSPSDVSHNSGNIGVGNPKPISFLDVVAPGKRYNINFGSNLQYLRAPLRIGETGSGGRNILIDANQIDQTKEDAALYLNATSRSQLVLNLGGGNVAIGDNVYPASKLQVKGGDVYIEDVKNGVIMKSPSYKF